MASLRRSKQLSPDGQTAKFLYTIIKQLDLKTVDWNEVAASLEITNGHAARMRYSRFKQQIEGLTTQSRSSKQKKSNGKITTSKGKGSIEASYVGLGQEEEYEEKKYKVEMTTVPHLDTMLPYHNVFNDLTPASSSTLGLKNEPDMVYGESALWDVRSSSELSTLQNFTPLNPTQVKAEAFGFQDNSSTQVPPSSTVSMAELELPPLPTYDDQFSFSTALADCGLDFAVLTHVTEPNPFEMPQIKSET